MSQLKETLRASILGKLKRNFSKDISEATKRELYDAAASSVMDSIQPNISATRAAQEQPNVRQMYYFSAEFLMGRALSNNLNNTGMRAVMEELLTELSASYRDIEDEEPDAGLGNGGLGRLAACFLDSLATLDYPGHGYGIRYQYGMFEQRIENGYQVEYPDNWRRYRDPWEIRRDDLAVTVRFGGTPICTQQEDGTLCYRLENAEEVIATPYDMAIIGYGTKTVNRLRLWEASSPNGFDLQLFNNMEYTAAVAKQNSAENISRVLYPNDSGPSGKALRLKQQYFFTSASLQDLVRSFIHKHGTNFSDFPRYNVIQLNDTHPVVAIPELMRLLMDEHHLGWDAAWAIVTQTFAYTNHTILAEALEKWPIEIFQGLLPRVYQIVEEINRRFLLELREKYPNDWKKHNKMSIIGEGKIRMAWLAIVGSFSVNGVAALHTEILKTKELSDWYNLYPQKFNNKTNGITFRRWLESCNEDLADYIKELIGTGYLTDAEKLEELLKFSDDKEVYRKLENIKKENKLKLKEYLQHTQDIVIDENSIIDTQIKRFHEYKRQQMNALYVIKKYLDIKSGKLPERKITVLFGGKAAPAYIIAQDIIHLILCLSEIINNDPEVNKYLNVYLVENYNVGLAEKIIPATDISEQISLASKEASGTGNMKFMLNGALTLGTMDGANVEICELVGNENIYIFGKHSDEIIELYEKEGYVSKDYYKQEGIKEVVDFITSEELVKVGNSERLERLHNELINKDWFMTLIDFNEYYEVKEKMLSDYENKDLWYKKVINNIAKAGFFSSDRTISQYENEIWKTKDKK